MSQNENRPDDRADVVALPSRPRGVMFDEPAANALWAAVMSLAPEVQVQFMERLRTYLVDIEAHGDNERVRVTRMVQSIREAYEQHQSSLPEDERGQALSQSRYEALRVQNPTLGWTPSRTARRLVQGTWNDVLRRCRLPEAEGGDVLLQTEGGRYSWEDVKKAVQDYKRWLEEHERGGDEFFTLMGYIQWAKRTEIRQMPGRRPRSQGPFDRFGGWCAVRDPAIADAELPPDPAAQQLARVRLGRVRNRAGYGLTPDQLKRSVLAVHEELGRVPRAADYQATRERLLHQAVESGERPLLVSYNMLVGQWGSWDGVLVACGLPPFGAVALDEVTGRAPARTGSSNHIPTEDLLAGIAEAFVAKGKPFSKSTYEAFREEHNGFSPTTGRRLAGYACVYNRYRHRARSPWKHACDKALPAGWNEL